MQSTSLTEIEIIRECMADAASVGLILSYSKNTLVSATNSLSSSYRFQFNEYWSEPDNIQWQFSVMF